MYNQRFQIMHNLSHLSHHKSTPKLQPTQFITVQPMAGLIPESPKSLIQAVLLLFRDIDLGLRWGCRLKIFREFDTSFVCGLGQQAVNIVLWRCGRGRGFRHLVVELGCGVYLFRVGLELIHDLGNLVKCQDGTFFQRRF